MGLKTGIVVGFAVGYYLGAKAGRERYEQLRRVVEGLPVGTVVEKTGAIVDLVVERFRDEVAEVAPGPVDVR